MDHLCKTITPECYRCELNKDEIGIRVVEGECKSCGSTAEDVTLAPDPFAEEIYGDVTPVWECENCRYESARDI